jgi:glycosyltransferase involved in cell wall biosynthesis
MQPTDLVLSYGDLIRPSGYRTRVLGEFRHLERGSDLEPYLLAFDRDAIRLEDEKPPDIEGRFRTRRAPLFLPELRRISRTRTIRLVHAHNLYSCALALMGRRRWGYRVVLDLHGRIPEEYVYLGKGGPMSKRILERLEQWTVRQSDHVVAVSEHLREYLLDRYELPPSDISVIPDCADETFRWDPGLRRTERQRMRLDDRFVCLHLGSFADWYRPDTIVSAFRAIREKVAAAHLSVVTPNPEQAAAFLEPRLGPNDYTVTRASHDQVPALLNAADLGFLLLPNTPNIRTSSPTKFSEYLNCGLPVLISPGVGDFSDLVTEQGVGCVLPEGRGDRVDRGLIETIASQRAEIAMRCVAAGKSLRWDAYRQVWNGILRRMETADGVSPSLR